MKNVFGEENDEKQKFNWLSSIIENASSSFLIVFQSQPFLIVFQAQPKNFEFFKFCFN